MTHLTITKHLLRLANPEIAEHSQRFFKTGQGEYGFGDKFLGIRVPVLRHYVKDNRKASLDTVEKLLKSEFHEIRLFALLLFVSLFNCGKEQKQKNIYQLYLKNTRYINNWDLVDSSAYHIVGAYLDHKDKKTLYELSASDALWERRIAIISTLYFIRNNNFDDTLKISRLLLHDKEDLMHKAVGWMLREVGKRDLSVEVMFLNKHYQKMPRTMLRYAIEKFTDTERQKYLKGKI